ncbi:MAG: winged helix-turn-helix domain-containing protein [Rubrivivax sp.]
MKAPRHARLARHRRHEGAAILAVGFSEASPKRASVRAGAGRRGPAKGSVMGSNENRVLASAASLEGAAVDGSPLRFAGHLWDPRRRALSGPDGAAIELRPKVELLLRHLLAQPGRVVGREELLAQLWPGLVVTDDSLGKCVAELRVALGDTERRLVRTLSRRGYVLEAEVEPVIPDPPVDAAADGIALAMALAAPPASGGEPAAVAAVPPAARRAFRREGWQRPGAYALLAAVLVAAAAWGLLRHDKPLLSIDAEIAARYTFAVLPFTADAEAARPLAGAAAEAVTTQLATRGVQCRVLGPAVTAHAVDATKDLAAIGRDLGARFVLTGRVVGRPTRVAVRVTAVDDGQVAWDTQLPLAATDAAAVELLGATAVAGLRRRVDELTRRSARADAPFDPVEAVLQGWEVIDRRAGGAELLRAYAGLERAVQADPNSIIALAGLGQAYLRTRYMRSEVLTEQQRAAAISAIERAVALAPNDYSAARPTWIHWQLQRRRPDLALPMAEATVRAAPSVSNAYVMAAQSLLMLGRGDEALDYLQRAQPVAAGDEFVLANIHALMAQILVAKERDAEAEALARRSIAARPSHVDAHAVLAALGGRPALAARELDELRRLRPGITLQSFDRWMHMDDPAFLAWRTRLYAGLRQAGLGD